METSAKDNINIT
jgi:hypothetical protein